MAFHYSFDIITYIFHINDPKDLDPSEAELEEFDHDLFKTFDARLIEKMEEFGIVINKKTKSQVLLLAFVSTGGSVPKRVSNACEYFLSVMGEG